MRLSRKMSKGRVLAGLCLLSLVLLLWPNQGGRWFCRVLRPVLVPLDAPGTYVTVQLRGRAQELSGKSPAADPARQGLEKELLDMQQLLQRQQEQIETLTRWRQVLGDFPCRLIPARVAFGEPLSLRQRKVLTPRKDENPASGDFKGVEPGAIVTSRRLVHNVATALPEKLAVLSDSYVIGRVVECRAHSATLQLVIDPSFQMPARLYRVLEARQQRTLQVTSPEGTIEKRTFRHDGRSSAPRFVGDAIEIQACGDGRQIRVEVDADHGVRPGDLVTTSDSGGALPVGLTLGRVTEVVPDTRNAHFVTALAEPLADLSAIDEVYIIQPYDSTGH